MEGEMEKEVREKEIEARRGVLKRKRKRQVENGGQKIIG